MQLFCRHFLSAYLLTPLFLTDNGPKLFRNELQLLVFLLDGQLVMDLTILIEYFLSTV